MTVAQDLHFGRQLQMHRKRRHLTQIQLSGLSALSVRAIRNLEQGQVAVPRKDTVRLLADALRLTSHERLSFKLAAGYDAGDGLLEPMPTVMSVDARPIRGRDCELNTLLRRVISGHQRIIAITGFRGVGKTQLAIAVARALQSRGSSSVLWASLRPNADDPPDDADAQPETGGQLWLPTSWADGLLARNGGVIERLVRLIGDHPTVLILDGNDAGQVSRDTMHELLRERPNLRIIETAQVPHGSVDEFQFPLQPLPVTMYPAGQKSGLSPAMELFIEFVTEVQTVPELDETAMSVLTEVCQRLDGMPGALEAAASWLKIFSLQQLLDLANAEPHVLSVRPGDRTGTTPAALDALAAQPRPLCDLLAQLARWHGAWSVNDVVARLAMPRARVAEAVYTFLRCGVIVQAPSPADVVRFTVLNILRPFLREELGVVAATA